MFLLVFLCCLFFLLSSQTFQKVLLVIFMVISILNSLHLYNTSHWTSYMILMIYLGGLLVLFLYFTSISGGFPLFNMKMCTALTVLCWTTSCYLFENPMTIFPNCSGVFLFSTSENIFILLLLFFLIFMVLIFFSCMPPISAPMRQN